METALYILLGFCAAIFWYLNGVFSVGLFVNAIKSPTISTERLSKRKTFFFFLAILGPILHALFLIYVALSMVIVLVCLPDRKYTLDALFDWCFLGLQEKAEEIDA